MLTIDILSLTRRGYLKDTKPPFLWEDDELLGFLNLVHNEWCKDTGCLRDDETAAICQIPILSNRASYSVDSRITEIHYGWLSTAERDVTVKDDIWISRNIYHWKVATGAIEFLIPDYGSTKLRIVRYPGDDTGYFSGSFTFTGTSKTIAQSGASFSTTLAVDDEIVISGTTLNGTTAIPKTFTVATVSTDSFTVSETVTDETPSAGIIQKITDTLNLTVSRLPLAQLTMTGMKTESPEIRFDYHPYLINGILREAYKKHDADTLDPEKEKKYGDLFEMNKLKARAEKDNLRYSETIAKPHYGAL